MHTRYDPERHHRHSIRLKGYDYTRAGAYFITINTQNNIHLFGEIINGEMRLNDAGTLIHQTWENLPSHYSSIDIDLFIVMPNHLHAILILESNPTNDSQKVYGQASVSAQSYGQTRRPAPNTSPLSVGDIIQRFKTFTAKLYTEGVHTHQWPHSPDASGTATTTNTSFATKNPSTPSANTSCKTPPVGENIPKMTPSPENKGKS